MFVSVDIGYTNNYDANTEPGEHPVKAEVAQQSHDKNR